MFLIPQNNVRFEAGQGLRVHIDRAEMRASNWVCIEGWIADCDRGEISVDSNWRNGHCILSERPDVCRALGLDASLAHGIAIHLLTPAEESGDEISVTLKRDATTVARLRIDLPKTSLRSVPFATKRAIALTQELYRDPSNGKSAAESANVVFLGGGVVAPRNFPVSFDNTRIGNYHPDIVEILRRPGTVVLDIGCGIRDTVFDNMVTQDVYPTPTATLISDPAETRLPFASETFDLVLLDSVLEHVPDPVALLEEGFRVLKPGGQIFGDAPFLQPLHLAPHHYFNFTPYGLEVVAAKAGLTLAYVAAEAHQRPEFSLEWMLRRTFELVPAAEAARLENMSVKDFLAGLTQNKELIDYPPEALTELAAGFRFHMRKQ